MTFFTNWQEEQSGENENFIQIPDAQRTPRETTENNEVHSEKSKNWSKNKPIRSVAFSLTL